MKKPCRGIFMASGDIPVISNQSHPSRENRVNRANHNAKPALKYTRGFTGDICREINDILIGQVMTRSPLASLSSAVCKAISLSFAVACDRTRVPHGRHPHHNYTRCFPPRAFEPEVKRAQPRRKKHQGFTLVELLVVIAILSVLAGLLLPALSQAMCLARRVSCQNNVRQMAQGTLLYLDDNQSLMEMGPFRSAFMGRCQQNYSQNNFYAEYLGGRIKMVGTQNYGMRFDPAPVVVCPSNPRSDYFRMSYSFTGGSTRDHRVTGTRLLGVFRDQVQAGKISGSGPALWSDRCNMYAAGNNGGMAETNHQNNDMPLGGNVANLDGSSRWFQYLGNTRIWDNEYILNSGAIGNYIAFPRNAVFPQTGGDWKLASPPRNQWVVGFKWTTFY